MINGSKPARPGDTHPRPRALPRGAGPSFNALCGWTRVIPSHRRTHSAATLRGLWRWCSPGCGSDPTRTKRPPATRRQTTEFV